MISSEGKIPAVNPMSTDMFAMVARALMSRFFTPGPKNSMILPMPALQVYRRSNSRIRSLPETNG